MGSRYQLNEDYPVKIGSPVVTIGIDWGPKGIDLIHRADDYGVIRWNGHMAWTSSIHPQHWAPTRWMLVKFIELNGDRCFEILVEVKPSHKWRVVQKRLMAIADESAERNSHTYETDLLNPQKILQS